MAHCKNCELYPVATIDLEPLCKDHVDQWNEILTRHAPLRPSIGSGETYSLQTGASTHKPRHW